MRIRTHHTTFLLATAATAIAIAAAPGASAAPSEQPCSDAGGSTTCQRPGTMQVYAAPRALPRVFPPSINPRWRDLGYSARFPAYPALTCRALSGHFSTRSRGGRVKPLCPVAFSLASGSALGRVALTGESEAEQHHADAEAKMQPVICAIDGQEVRSTALVHEQSMQP